MPGIQIKGLLPDPQSSRHPIGTPHILPEQHGTPRIFDPPGSGAPSIQQYPEAGMIQYVAPQKALALFISG